MAQSLQYKTLLSDGARDDSAEVNLSIKLKKKKLEVDIICILNNYFLSVNHANCIKSFTYKKIKYFIFKIISLTEKHL